MKRKGYKKIDWIAVILLLAGGLNWGLVGFFDYNLVQDLLPNLYKYVYMLVGISFGWVSFRGLMKKFMK